MLRPVDKRHRRRSVIILASSVDAHHSKLSHDNAICSVEREAGAGSQGVGGDG